MIEYNIEFTNALFLTLGFKKEEHEDDDCFYFDHLSDSLRNLFSCATYGQGSKKFIHQKYDCSPANAESSCVGYSVLRYRSNKGH